MKVLLIEDQIQGICNLCLKNKQMPGPKSKLGFKTYIKFCSSCAKKKYNKPKSFKSKFKDTKCNKCGFIPIDQCQLDLHHKDRNKRNNTIENLETLCANCHRLEHKEERQTKKWPQF